MIRRHKLIKPISKTLIRKVMDHEKPNMYQYAWEQVEGKYYKELEEQIYNALGLKEENHGLVFHFFTGTIETHYDRMDKRCLLVPLKVTNSMSFHEQDQYVKIKYGEYYSFNDFYDHGLSNEYQAYGLVASVSKDYATYIRAYKEYN